ncbi:MAG TPA: Uma2 family endonuclease [Pirellulales bacterium]|jgi:Uma2 family endonuclease|nr:Uma2 family endonuclease [Pirellulales bacterium]
MSLAPNLGDDSSRQAWKDLLEEFLPRQGEWTEEQYLVFTDHSNRLVELTDGCLEVLPMPTDRHQAVLAFLYGAFLDFIGPRGGKVRFAPLRLRISAHKFREPDLVLLVAANDVRRQDRFWTGADLALEVVSPDKPRRDLIEKRGDYAEGGVGEYWIVNPETESINVLRLESGAYAQFGAFRRGEAAASALLPGFKVEVGAVFDAD